MSYAVLELYKQLVTDITLSTLDLNTRFRFRIRIRIRMVKYIYTNKKLTWCGWCIGHKTHNIPTK